MGPTQDWIPLWSAPTGSPATTPRTRPFSAGCSSSTETTASRASCGSWRQRCAPPPPPSPSTNRIKVLHAPTNGQDTKGYAGLGLQDTRFWWSGRPSSANPWLCSCVLILGFLEIQQPPRSRSRFLTRPCGMESVSTRSHRPHLPRPHHPGHPILRASFRRPARCSTTAGLLRSKTASLTGMIPQFPSTWAMSMPPPCIHHA